MSRPKKFLEKINNTSEKCSEIDKAKSSESEDDLFKNDNGLLDTDSEPLDTDMNNEEENILNTRRGQKRMKLFSSSEDEYEENDQKFKLMAWQKIQADSGPGRSSLHNIFRETSGPTGYAKRNIMKGKIRTAFSLIIDYHIMNHIKTCTESEPCRVLGLEWSLTQANLDAFIAILYARDAYEARNLRVSCLWNKKWGPTLFSRTIASQIF